MARTSRSRRQRERGRGGRKPPPGVRTLLAYLLPFAALAVLADWIVCHEMLSHHRKYGHTYVPGIGMAMALSLTGAAISVPFFWLQARKQVDRHQRRSS